MVKQSLPEFIPETDISEKVLVEVLIPFMMKMVETKKGKTRVEKAEEKFREFLRACGEYKMKEIMVREEEEKLERERIEAKRRIERA